MFSHKHPSLIVFAANALPLAASMNLNILYSTHIQFRNPSQSGDPSRCATHKNALAFAMVI